MANPNDNIWGIMRQDLRSDELRGNVPAQVNQRQIPPGQPFRPPVYRAEDPYDDEDNFDHPPARNMPQLPAQSPRFFAANPQRVVSPKLPPLNYNRPLEGEERLRALEQLMGVAPDLAARLRAVERRAQAAEQLASSAAEQSQSASQDAQRQMATLSTHLRHSQAELAVVKQRLEQADAQQAERNAQVQRLQAMIDNETRRSAEELRAREHHHALYNDGEQRRMQTMAEELMRVQGQLEVVKREAEAARNATELEMQRLHAKLGAEAGFVHKLRDAELDSVQVSAQQFASMKARFSEVHAQLESLAEQVSQESSARRQDVQNLLGKVREVGSTAGERAGELSGDMRSLLDRKGEEAARRFRSLEEALAKQAAELRESENRAAAAGRKEAEERRKAAERLRALEGTLREVHSTGHAADRATLQSVEKSHVQLAALVREEKQEREGKEARLREQMQGALLKLRAFARDLEEKQEQGRLQLEGVVRMEIKARFKAVEKLSQSVVEVGQRADKAHEALRRHMEAESRSVRGEIYNNVVEQVLESEIAHLEVEERIQKRVDQKVASLEETVDGIEKDLEDGISMLQSQMAASSSSSREAYGAVEEAVLQLRDDWRAELLATKAGATKDLGELEDVMAAALKDIRSGIVKERKEMYDALTSQNKEQARLQAQLGAQLQEGINSLSDSSSVRETKLVDLMEETKKDVRDTIDGNKAEVSGLMESLMEAVDQEVLERKQMYEQMEATSLVKSQELREEVAGLMQHASAAQEEGLERVHQILDQEVQQRSLELERVSAEMSELRWSSQEAAKEAADAIAAVERQVGDEAFQRAEQISNLRSELHGTVADARLQEEAVRLEMLEEVDKSRGETQVAISSLAEDITAFMSKQGEASEGLVARAASTEEELGRRLDELQEQCKTMQEVHLKDLDAQLASESRQRGVAVRELAEAVRVEADAREGDAQRARDELFETNRSLQALEALVGREQLARESGLEAQNEAWRGATRALREAVDCAGADLATAELRWHAALDAESHNRQVAMDAAAAEASERLAAVATDAAGVHTEHLRELGERVGAMESDLAGQKAGTEEGMLKLAQDLVGLVEESSEAAKEEVEAIRNRLEAVADQSESLAQAAEILSRQVAATETLAEAAKAANEQLAEQLDAGLQQEAEERDSKFLEVNDLLTQAVGSSEDAAAAVEAEAVQRQAALEALEAALKQAMAEGQAEMKSELAAELARVAAMEEVHAALKQIQQETLPDLEAQLAAESRQRGDVVKDAIQRITEEAEARKQQVESVQSEVLGVTAELIESLEREEKERSALVAGIKSQVALLQAKLEEVQLQLSTQAVPQAEVETALVEEGRKAAELAGKVRELETRVLVVEAQMKAEEGAVTSLRTAMLGEQEGIKETLMELDLKMRDANLLYKDAMGGLRDQIVHQLKQDKMEDRAIMQDLRNALLTNLGNAPRDKAGGVALREEATHTTPAAQQHQQQPPAANHKDAEATGEVPGTGASAVHASDKDPPKLQSPSGLPLAPTVASMPVNVENIPPSSPAAASTTRDTLEHEGGVSSSNLQEDHPRAEAEGGDEEAATLVPSQLQDERPPPPPPQHPPTVQSDTGESVSNAVPIVAAESGGTRPRRVGSSRGSSRSRTPQVQQPVDTPNGMSLDTGANVEVAEKEVANSGTTNSTGNGSKYEQDGPHVEVPGPDTIKNIVGGPSLQEQKGEDGSGGGPERGGQPEALDTDAVYAVEHEVTSQSGINVDDASGATLTTAGPSTEEGGAGS